MGFDDKKVSDKLSQNVINLPQNVIIEGRKKLIVTGVRQVLRFDEDELLLDTIYGILSVHGSEFRMERFSNDAGEVTATGFVSAVEYESDHPSSAGFLSRFFHRS